MLPILPEYLNIARYTCDRSSILANSDRKEAFTYNNSLHMQSVS